MRRATHKTILTGLLILLAPLTVTAQDLEARYRSGMAALQQGDPLRAIEILGSVAAQQRDYRDVQMLLGQSCLMAGLHRPAKQHFERALQTQPQNGQAAFLLGFSLYQAARYFEAAEALQKAGRMSPQNPLPAMYRGLALLRLGDARGARQEIDTALRLAPQDPIARAARAELELAEGNYGAAETSIRSVLGQTPQQDDAQLLLGRILLESGRPGEAVGIFAGLVQKSDGKRSDVLYLLGQAQLRSGESAPGRETLERFRRVKAKEGRLRVLEAEVSTDPDDLAARIELTGILLELGQPQAAAVHLATLRQQAPQDRRVRDLDTRLRSASAPPR
jgi:Tfp pilus assembly protein PilF